MERDQVKQYDCFVDEPEKLSDGMEMELVIRDLTPGKNKYDSKYVRAKILSPHNKLPGSGVLFVRSRNGQLQKKQWLINVLEELGAYKTETPNVGRG